MSHVYALNLFDLAENDDYRAYARRSVNEARKHGGEVVAMGRLAGTVCGGTSPRGVLILVQWPSREALDAFVRDSSAAGLEALRERGTERYLWWVYERLEDLGPLFPTLLDEMEEAVAAGAGEPAGGPPARARLQATLAQRARSLRQHAEGGEPA